MNRSTQLGAGAAVAALALAAATPSLAAAPDPSTDPIATLREQVARQAEQLDAQARQLKEAREALARQAAAIARLEGVPPAALAEARGLGPAPAPGPLAPVGEAPPPRVVQVPAAPEGFQVLLPAGQLSLEPGLAYTHGSSNRLVFRGIEIVTGVQIGVIEANDADNNAAEAVLSARYGVSRRLEVDLRVPYLNLTDRVTTVQQRDEQISRTLSLRGSGAGDVEFAARYQINSGLGGWPVFIAGVRAKSDTGTGPFEVKRDEFGVAQALPTGSGFWGVEGSLAFLYPSDPVVMFGGVSYLDQVRRRYNREVGGVLVGKVDPGNAIGANLGFGFALNPRFSFSLGYKHTYIFPTKTVFDRLAARSNSLQVGAFIFGWSFALTDRISINSSYEVGATRDAPDMRAVLTVPIRF